MGDHLRTIYRYKWFILGSAVLTAEIVLVVSLLRPATYEAESSIWITVESQDGFRLDEERADYAGRVYAELAESPRLIERAIEASGLSIEPPTARNRLDVDPGRPPGFVDIVASGPSASSAARLANGMAAALVESVDADTTGPDTNPNVEDDTPEVSFVSAEIIVPADWNVISDHAAIAGAIERRGDDLPENPKGTIHLGGLTVFGATIIVPP